MLIEESRLDCRPPFGKPLTQIIRTQSVIRRFSSELAYAGRCKFCSGSHYPDAAKSTLVDITQFPLVAGCTRELEHNMRMFDLLVSGRSYEQHTGHAKMNNEFELRIRLRILRSYHVEYQEFAASQHCVEPASNSTSTELLRGTVPDDLGQPYLHIVNHTTTQLRLQYSLGSFDLNQLRHYLHILSLT